MTVTITRDAKPLGSSPTVSPRVAYYTHWFSGDNSKTEFDLPSGWKPKKVFVDGLLKRVGASEDYTVINSGFRYTVVFAVAPAAVSVGVDSERLIL